MAYETRIGWRYLFRRRCNRVSLVLALVSFVGTVVAIFLPRDVPLLTVGPWVLGLALSTIVFGLLSFFSVFTTVAVLGVTMGVSALIVVLSVTSGFQETFKDKVLGVNAHVIVMKWGPDFSEYTEVARKIETVPQVVAASPFIFTDLQIARGQVRTTVHMKGIDPDASLRVLDLGSQIVAGDVASLRRDGAGLLLGRELAKKLRVTIGDSVTLLPPLYGVDSVFFRTKSEGEPTDFVVRGIFDAGFEDYDRGLVYLSLPGAQKLLGRGDVVSGVEVKLRDPHRSRSVSGKIGQLLGEKPYRVIEWSELNHNLFAALRLQKLVISLFLTIIIVVAAFNIVASLSMIVLSKRKEIAILKSMGVSSPGMSRIFQVAGLTIGAIGVVTGIGLGLYLCQIARRYGYPLDPKIYLVSRLPVHVRALEVGATAWVTLLVCLAATLYPSGRAARLAPVEGLRSE